MKNEGIPPSIITFNSLIDACVRSGRMTQAWKVLEQMISLSGDNGVVPDNFTYSTLIKGISSEEYSADLDKAFELLGKLQENP
mmetsp:Transcript_22778/g.17208  ORF Transcript_22778/g.17208 Transcript_22778/m.17208 type:complete len:83 (+) Transcript_22778:435-683(+)